MNNIFENADLMIDNAIDKLTDLISNTNFENDKFNKNELLEHAEDMGYQSGVQIGLQVVYDIYGLEKLLKLRQQMIKENKIPLNYSLSFIKFNELDKELINEVKKI